MTVIWENVKVFAWQSWRRCRHRRQRQQGYDNTSTSSSKTAELKIISKLSLLHILIWSTAIQTLASKIGSTLYEASSSSSESELSMFVSNFSKASSITLTPRAIALVTFGISSASLCSLVFSCGIQEHRVNLWVKKHYPLIWNLEITKT